MRSLVETAKKMLLLGALTTLITVSSNAQPGKDKRDSFTNNQLAGVNGLLASHMKSANTDKDSGSYSPFEIPGLEDNDHSAVFRHTNLLSPGKGQSIGRRYPVPAKVPESNTMVGFGAALFINGIGVAGTGYYLRRRYNRESAKRYARRQVYRMPMLLDVALSVIVLLVVSPILFAIFAVGAFNSHKPTVF